MKIKKLILENFRRFKEKTIVSFDDLTVIVGKNDAGKSTLLEALDIFLNDKKANLPIDKDDACKYSDSEKIKIGIVFSEFPEDVNIDEGNMTSLKDEYLLNEDSLLEIHKTFKGGSCKGTYIIANHPTNELASELMLKKISELKKIVEDNGFTCEDKGKNASLRKAIRENCGDLQLQEVEIPVDKEDTKKIWDKLESYLPIYGLFKSDRANKDQDDEVQDPINLMVKGVLSQEDLQKRLQEIAKEVMKISKTVVDETLDKLKEMNSEIAEELRPVMPPVDKLKWDSVFKKISIESDNGIPLNKRGSGVRRLVLLNFFRAQAEKKKEKESKKHIVYAFEEPETSQHPHHQKILIEALKKLSEQDERQIMITTHSPNIVQLMPKESLRLVCNEDGLSVKSGDLAISDIIGELGVLPMINKAVVFVEGENDRNFLLGINEAIKELKAIVDVGQLPIIPLGGSVLKKWVNRNYLDGSNIIEFHLYDRDSDEKYLDAVKTINGRPGESFGTLTEKLEIENYIHKSLIEGEAKFATISLENIEDFENADIPQFIKENVDSYKNSTLSGAERSKADKKAILEIKSILCGPLSKRMTKELMENLGIWDEVKGWFEKIKALEEIAVK